MNFIYICEKFFEILMNKSYLMAVLVAAAMGLVSCNKTEQRNINDQGRTDKNSPVLINMGGLPNAGMWTYVDLKTHKSETYRDFTEWLYYNVDMQTKTYKLVRKEPAKGSLADVKINWTISINRNGIRTNGCEVAMTNSKDLKTAPIPDSGYKKDEEIKSDVSKGVSFVVDFSNMMSGGPMGYASSITRNPLLSTWLKKTVSPGAAHGQYNFELNDNVFVVKCKDGSIFKLKFTDYRNPEGKKDFCKFEILPVENK